MTKSRGSARREVESLVEAGRKLVRASADIPSEALEFLGRPLSRRGRRPPEGAVPGEMAVPQDAPAPILRIVSYDANELEERSFQEVAGIREYLHAPGRTVWIDVAGLGSRGTLEELREILGIHPLAMADLVHAPQRPKAELHDHHLLVITQMARVTPAGMVDVEQVSLVLGPGWVLTFREMPGDVFDPIRARLRSPATRVRHLGADYLLYALVDAVIDGYFPVVEALGGVIDALEQDVIEQPSRASLARIHATRRVLLSLHRVQWRQLDAVNVMLRDQELPISENVKPYLRDAHDHAFQTLDAIDTYRDMLVGIVELYMSSASHRMNEVMRTLTVVATLFIPLTFMTGVYGMNFRDMPELQWHWGYPAFWISMLVLGGGLLLWFRRRGWLGAPGVDDA
jgi:magnesium transporter